MCGGSADPNDPYNGPAYWTGRLCIEPGCYRLAGTAWSPHWCQPCNAERMRRITRQLEALHARAGG
jgi:hypothetical protein